MYEHAIKGLQERQTTLDQLIKTTTSNVNENRDRLNLHIAALSAVERERAEVTTELGRLRELQKAAAREPKVVVEQPARAATTRAKSVNP